MVLQERNLIDEILNQIDDELSVAFRTTPTSRVIKNTRSSKVVSSMPYVSATAEKTVYKSRYTHFIKWVESFVFTDYPYEKLDGFKAALNRYIDMANASPKNFKALDKQIEKDLNDYADKVSGNADYYLLGYYDALVAIKKVLNQSKVTRFQELKDKIV